MANEFRYGIEFPVETPSAPQPKEEPKEDTSEFLSTEGEVFEFPTD